MSGFYYLAAQLPCIVPGQPLSITEKYYRDLCSRFFDERQKAVLDALSLVPPLGKAGCAFLDAWYGKERALRLALATVRAQKLHRDAPISSEYTADVLQAARTAVGLDPLAAERFLYEYRLSVLNSLRPQDMFSFDSMMEYGVRLMLEARMRLFDKEAGTAAYKTIYDSILGGA